MKTERRDPSEPPLSLMGLGFWLLFRRTVPAVGPALISNETEGEADCCIKSLEGPALLKCFEHTV